MKKLLITGGSGLLGQYLNLSASKRFDIVTTFRNNTGNSKNFSCSKIDIRNQNELEKIFDEVKPDILIHAAAITNSIKNNNQTPKDYFNTNVTATKNISELCEKHNSKIIYISTDLVYAGYRGSLIKEDGKLIPASLYAETKLVGETKVKETTENYLILRTALLYGFGLNHSRCHFHWMYAELKNKKPVKLFTNQFRSPISLKDTANIITDLSAMELKGETINLGGTERVSRYELGEMLCSIASFDKNLLQKITMDELPDFPKVEDVSLNIDKLISLGFKPRSIEKNIAEIIGDN